MSGRTSSHLQVATQLDRILEHSLKFTVSGSKKSSTESCFSRLTDTSCGRLFKEAVPTAGGLFPVNWQSEFTAKQQSELDKATQQGMSQRKKRQRLPGLSV